MTKKTTELSTKSVRSGGGGGGGGRSSMLRMSEGRSTWRPGSSSERVNDIPTREKSALREIGDRGQGRGARPEEAGRGRGEH